MYIYKDIQNSLLLHTDFFKNHKSLGFRMHQDSTYFSIFLAFSDNKASPAGFRWHSLDVEKQGN